ncbi:hypothetical protein LCGC14_1401910, partial [marine sediment metagenome]
LDTSYLPFELEFFEYKKDEFKMYKFRRTGELPGTALKTVWLPQDYSLSEVKDYIRKHYFRIQRSDQYLDFELGYDGIILKQGKTVNNKLIDDDIIFSALGLVGPITIAAEQSGSSGQLRSSRQSYDYQSKDGSPQSQLTAELFKRHEGYRFLWSDVGYLMAGKGNLENAVTSDEIATDVDELYFQIYRPLKESFKLLFKDITYNRKALRSSLQSLFLRVWASPEATQRIISSGKNLKEYLEAGSDIFDKQFPVEMFENAQDWNRIIDQRIGYVIYDYIMRNELGLDQQGISPNMFHQRLKNFIIDMSVGGGIEFQLLQQEILSETQKTAFLLSFSEIFFPPNANEELSRTAFGYLKSPTSFFGWIKEALHFFGGFESRVIDKIVKYGSDFKIYKFMEWSPQITPRTAAKGYNIDLLNEKQPEIRTDWNNGIDISKVRGIPTKGREMDMLSLLWKELSFTTHVKTLREWSYKRITERISSVINDYWSSMIADAEIFSSIGSNQEIASGVMRDHEADIVTTLNYFGEFVDRKEISIKIAEKLFSIRKTVEINPRINTYSVQFKSPTDLNLFYAITDLINKELNNLQIFDASDIFNLFSNTDFESKFWKAVKSNYNTDDTSKFDDVFENDNNLYITFYNAIRTVFTSNFDKLFQKTISSNQLVWDNDVGSYLLARDSENRLIPLTKELLPEDIMTLSGDDWINLPSDYNFQESGAHVIISGDDGEIGVLPLTRIIEIKGKLPEGVYLGYEGIKSAIICNSEGNLLNGVVSLDTVKRQFVVNNEWYESQTKNNIIDPTNTEDPNGVFTLDNAYRAMILSTGDHVKIIFQKQVVNLVPIKPFKPLFPGTTIIHSAISILKKAVSLKEVISLENIEKINFLLPIIHEITFSLDKGLREASMSDISHNLLTITNDLFGIHNPSVDIEYITNNLKIIEPRVGEVFYDGSDSSAWLSNIIQFSFIENDNKIKGHSLDSFKLRNNILKLIKNVLDRGSADSSYNSLSTILSPQLFEYFMDKNFQGEQFNAPIIDESLGIDEIELMNQIDEAITKLFGYIGVFFIKQGLLTFSRSSMGDYNVDCLTHNQFDLFKFAQNFQLRPIVAGNRRQSLGDMNYKSPPLTLNIIISFILTGHQERITTVDINGVLNTDFEFITNLPENSPFLRGLFDVVIENNLEFTTHQSIRDIFKSTFYDTFLSDINSHKLFIEGRDMMKSKIHTMLEKQVSLDDIKQYFEEEINTMFARRANTGITLEDCAIIKRLQIIEYMARKYTDSIYYPAQPLSPSKAIKGVNTIGDILLDFRHLLKSAADTTFIPFVPYGGIPTNPFFSDFQLTFSLNDFNKKEISKIIPTLAYNYWNLPNFQTRFRGDSALLYDLRAIFPELKEQISTTFKNFELYFANYIGSTGVNTFGIKFYLPKPNG